MVVWNLFVVPNDDGVLISTVELINGLKVVDNVDSNDDTANVGFGFCFVNLIVVCGMVVFAGMVVFDGVDVFGVFCIGFLLVVV